MLDGKICIVTGGASGIGRASAIEMARQGAGAVMIGDIDEAGARETVELVRAAGARAEQVRCDMTVSDEIRRLIETTVSEFGGLDVLHNNAGAHESSLTTELTVETLPAEVFDAIYRLNLRGPWLAMKYAAPHLRRSERNPSIINAASTGGVTGHANMNAYGATKAGLIQLTRCVAVDLAPAVRVNCYAPAGVDTPMVRRFREADGGGPPDEIRFRRQLIPRIGRVEEIAQLVCYLASDAAAWVTGAMFPIDGGLLSWRGPA
jgi:NAD(P)-dependent dehydrogenase (short-subunit alcohol dehydrogenase family)